MKAGAIILAGGKSSRMKTNKALLKFDEKTNIERIKDELKQVFDDIILVTNNPEIYQFLNIKTVSDQFPGSGPLAGIHAGLEASDYEENIVVACDMPFLNPALIRNMLGRCKGFDVVVPDLKGELQPLHAIYSRRCIGHIQERIAEGEFRIFDFYPEVLTLHLEERVCREVDPENRSFANINTQEELTRARRWIEGLEQRNDDGQG